MLKQSHVIGGGSPATDIALVPEDGVQGKEFRVRTERHRTTWRRRLEKSTSLRESWGLSPPMTTPTPPPPRLARQIPEMEMKYCKFFIKKIFRIQYKGRLPVRYFKIITFYFLFFIIQMEKKVLSTCQIGIYEFLFESESMNFFWIQGRQMIRHGPIRIPLPPYPSQKRCTVTYS